MVRFSFERHHTLLMLITVKSSKTEMAKKLKKDKSTISYEIKAQCYCNFQTKLPK